MLNKQCFYFLDMADFSKMEPKMEKQKKIVLLDNDYDSLMTYRIIIINLVEQL